MYPGCFSEIVTNTRFILARAKKSEGGRNGFAEKKGVSLRGFRDCFSERVKRVDENRYTESSWYMAQRATRIGRLKMRWCRAERAGHSKLTRQGSTKCYVNKEISSEWGKMKCERALKGLNSGRRNALGSSMSAIRWPVGDLPREPTVDSLGGCRVRCVLSRLASFDLSSGRFREWPDTARFYQVPAITGRRVPGTLLVKRRGPCKLGTAATGVHDA